MLELYKNIKRLREEKGLSQDTLAKLTGYTDRSSIAKIEKGIVDLQQSKIALFAKALDTTSSELMGWDDNLTDDNAELMVDILTDSELIESIQKLNKLSAEHKQTIYDTITYWYEKEGHSSSSRYNIIVMNKDKKG